MKRKREEWTDLLFSLPKIHAENSASETPAMGFKYLFETMALREREMEDMELVGPKERYSHA